VHLVHGTRDHFCDFTATYEIARRMTAPCSVHPLVGIDHDAAIPAVSHFADPGIAWLNQTL
jgi:hypothetical protein